MADITILDLSRADDWQTLLDRLPVYLRDIYFTPQYHALYEINGDGKARLFTYQSGADIWFFPYLQRPVGHVGAVPVPFVCADTETAYGYGGPLCTTSDPNFLRAAQEAYDGYCCENCIVTDFIRFHPLIGNHCLLESIGPTGVKALRNYVWVDLTQTTDDLWSHSYSGKNRNMVRKAQRQGVRIRHAATSTEFGQFVEMYLATMARLSADRYYFFSTAYFAALERLVAARGVALLAHVDDEVVAASVLFRHEQYAHYHLSASSERGRTLAATNLLLHEGILWAREMGATKMHLGGGMTAAADDPLLRFKAGYSPLRTTFRIGRRIHDEQAYLWLVGEWDRQHSQVAPAYQHILQRYRLQL